MPLIYHVALDVFVAAAVLLIVWAVYNHARGN